jgi:TetR/AcrR family transcriptional regulator, transcriptional repressor for nem operon
LVYFCTMRKSERTKQQIIEATAPIFNAKGFAGTSLSDLCKATGLTKGALYGNFESKEELAIAGFQHAIEKMRWHARAQVDAKNGYKEKLIGLLEFFAQYVLSPPVKGGCPLLNTAVEADDYRVSMRKAVTRELEEMISFIVSLLDKGKKAREFRIDIKSREQALVFFCAIEGAIMFSRVSGSDEAMKTVIKNIKNTVESFSLR